ncbi:hypothetical protein Moror_12026, partial [Moniliophthora roreri MCA 2997]
ELRPFAKTALLAKVARERGFIRRFETTRAFGVGIDLSPLLDGYKAKQIALTQNSLHAPTNLMLSQF